MCGRFTLRTPTPVLIEHFRLGRIPPLPARFNIAPTQQVAAVRVGDAAARELTELRWGLIPSWAKDKAIGARMINARSETAAEKPSFRAAFKRRRCLIPADGFYEWQKGPGKQKQPYLIELAGGEPFAFAGLWESWRDPDQDAAVVETCTILTTEANARMAEIHDRMPVIVSPGDYDLWLDPSVETREPLGRLFHPYPSDQMTTTPVSTHVNSPRNDDSRCVVQQQTLF